MQSAGRGAEAVLLGGTDLFLAFEGRNCGFLMIDCAAIHMDAICVGHSTEASRWQPLSICLGIRNDAVTASCHYGNDFRS